MFYAIINYQVVLNSFLKTIFCLTIFTNIIPNKHFLLTYFVNELTLMYAMTKVNTFKIDIRGKIL